ncbi:MAG: histidine kinase [Cyclobacteriaceae bacterium]|nr:histidine kinase [Cyclobacteriaceae bacterium]
MNDTVSLVNIFNLFIYSDKKTVRISRHLVFWIVDIINWLVVVASRGAAMPEIYVFLCGFPFIVVTAYVIMYYLIPRYAATSDLNKLLIYIGLSLLVLGVGMRLLKYFVLFPLLWPENLATYVVLSPGRIVAEIFSSLGVIAIAIVIKLIKNKTRLENENEQLMREKREAELSFLKAQMHPHFLFNTLNTLYAEAVRQSDRRSERVVLHLSSLLRFILEECTQPLITLEKEIKVIQDYIALEQLRHGSRLKVSFHHHLSDASAMLSPLLLLPFIENSFKHSLASMPGTVEINISLQASGSKLTLQVENDCNSVDIDFGHQGVGIYNIRKQLDLLFRKNYELHTTHERNKYRIRLEIPLNIEASAGESVHRGVPHLEPVLT